MVKYLITPLFVLSLFLHNGCSMTHFNTANPLKKGEKQIGVGGAVWMADWNSGIVLCEIDGRMGLTESGWVDIGLKSEIWEGYSSPSVIFDARFRFLNQDKHGISMALQPGAGPGDAYLGLLASRRFDWIEPYAAYKIHLMFSKWHAGFRLKTWDWMYVVPEATLVRFEGPFDGKQYWSYAGGLAFQFVF